MKRKVSLKIRKAHRYLGIFLGFQFLFWTISGLYFSWTNLDEIHGDHYKNLEYEPLSFENLISPSLINTKEAINTLEIRDINKKPYYFVNKKWLFSARSGIRKNELTKNEALYIANKFMKEGLEVKSIEKITEVGKHHEYRKKLLPAYVISYKSDDNLKAYVSISDAKFQSIRHRSWRWFDFLWMTHTMDYEGRDNFNTITLRAFSLLGLITVLSGFTLAFVTTPKLMRFFKKN
tara:strand:- start:1437 stop:2138 length:702 start_codon:yes stop_codon:yes gene_type:complete